MPGKKKKGKKKKGKKKAKGKLHAGADLIFDPPEDLTPNPERVDLIVRLANPATQYLSRQNGPRLLNEGASDDAGVGGERPDRAAAPGRDQRRENML